MKIELEPQDIDAVAHRIAELLKPVLTSSRKEKLDDTIFNVPGLAGYLKVSSKWIYERTHLGEIPYIKLGGHVRFSKKDIDEWVAHQAIKTSV